MEENGRLIVEMLGFFRIKWEKHLLERIPLPVDFLRFLLYW
jgi:hypothetical protein